MYIISYEPVSAGAPLSPARVERQLHVLTGCEEPARQAGRLRSPALRHNIPGRPPTLTHHSHALDLHPRSRVTFRARFAPVACWGSPLTHGLVVPADGAARAQALGTWRDLQLRLAGRSAPLAPLATCAAIEEAALALPLLVQASADSLEDLAACAGDGATRSGAGEPRDAAAAHGEAAPAAAAGGGAGRGAAWEREAGPVQAVLDGIAAKVEAAAPAGLFQRRAASGGALAVQLAHLHEVGGLGGAAQQAAESCVGCAPAHLVRAPRAERLARDSSRAAPTGIACGDARQARGARGVRARGLARAGRA
jgi:hypothetical protein